ncbi:hypothetical protein PIB30_006978 [Stylosanthes scabra]|uniref:Uncharacterized protein n=1 Tax=Stylosanthes scabra TaxID=79078 RepID=A0ABU6Z1F5_9FABA|nr:hypothetical protein [Stylosanthes scabra]
MEEEQNILRLPELENDLDSENKFEANYEFSDNNEDVNNVDDLVVHEVMQTFARNDSFGIPRMMRALNLDAMNAPIFLEYTTIGFATPKDAEFVIGMTFTSRKSVISAIKKYTFTRGVDYMVHESEPLTFYTKCM